MTSPARDRLSPDDVLAFVCELAEGDEDAPHEARLLLLEMRRRALLLGASREMVAALFPPDGSASAEAFASGLKLTVAEVWGIVDNHQRRRCLASGNARSD